MEDKEFYKFYLIQEITRHMDILRESFPEVEMRLCCFDSGDIKEDENGDSYIDVLDSYFTFN